MQGSSKVTNKTKLHIETQNLSFIKVVGNLEQNIFHNCDMAQKCLENGQKFKSNQPH